MAERWPDGSGRRSGDAGTGRPRARKPAAHEDCWQSFPHPLLPGQTESRSSETRTAGTALLLKGAVAAKPPSALRRCTAVGLEQLRPRKGTFEKTLFPHWVTTAELTAATHLDEFVIGTWVKTRHVKRRKQQLHTWPSLAQEAPNPIVSAKEEETTLSVTSTNAVSCIPAL